MSTQTKVAPTWRLVNQTQTEHLKDYCTLSHSIRYESGEFTVKQRILDTPEGYAEGQARAQLITAAHDLLKAAELTVLHFQRNQVSGNFQGDDEHEAWTALDAAIAKAKDGQ